MTGNIAYLVDYLSFCVPKVDTLEEYYEIDSLLASEEKKYKLAEGHFKLIPQVESTLSVVNAKDIFKADS